MKLSLVIPTYNMADDLHVSLSCAAAQQAVAHDEIELLIVDDGSTDHTRQVVSQFSTQLPALRYEFIPRTPSSGRSAARNRGMSLARGDLISFIDCGVAFSPRFAAIVIARLARQESTVLLHYVLGHALTLLRATRPYTHDPAATAKLSPLTFEAVARELEQLPEWGDSREWIMPGGTDSLDELPAPWSLGYSTAISFPHKLISASGGFDTNFIGWGIEDVELCYRLHLAGASFAIEREAKVIHIPHKTEPIDRRLEQLRKNAEQMHRKHGTRETELTTIFWGGCYLNSVLARLDAVGIQHLLPAYSANVLRTLVAPHLNSNSLLIGIDSPAVANNLPAHHLLAHNPRAHDRMKRFCPARDIRSLIGLSTGDPDQRFDAVLVSDFVRVLPLAIAGPLLCEAVRIGKRAFLLFTDFTSPHLTRDGQPWATLSQLEELAKDNGLTLIDEGVCEGGRLFRLARLKTSVPH